MKNIVLVAIVAVAVVLVGTLLIISSLNQVADKVSDRLSLRLVQLEQAVTRLSKLGSTPGTEFFDGLYSASERSLDGTISNETNASGLTAKQFCEDKYITLGFATSGVTAVTLPSGQSLFSSCLQQPESSRTVYLRNATSSGSVSYNITAGGSSTLYRAYGDSGAQSTSTLGGGALGELTGIRMASGTDVHVLWILDQFR